MAQQKKHKGKFLSKHSNMYWVALGYVMGAIALFFAEALWLFEVGKYVCHI